MPSKKATKSAKVQHLKKALAAATVAREDFALQQAGWTDEERDFNRASYEFLIGAWCALSREYANTMDIICGPDWYAKGM